MGESYLAGAGIRYRRLRRRDRYGRYDLYDRNDRSRPQQSPRSLVVTLLLGFALFLAMPADAFAGDHNLVFATDYHNSGDSLTTVLDQMPKDTQYVSIIGDLVGNMSDMTPAYQSS